MASKDLRFKVGGRDFFIPADAAGNYEEAEEMTDALLAKGDKPEQGVWLPGGWSKDVEILAHLQDLGVLGPDFFSLPVIAGSFWYVWDKNLDGKSREDDAEILGYVRSPDSGRVFGTYVTAGQRQRLYFTNWSRIR